MYIFDNYLSFLICVIFGVVMLLIWRRVSLKVKKEIIRQKMFFFGVLVVFLFLIMMFNLFFLGGIIGYVIGGVFVVILFGLYFVVFLVIIVFVI